MSSLNSSTNSSKDCCNQQRLLLVSKSADIFLLVIAHPDDECMFFIPTILNLTSTTQAAFHILCLSNGNYHGLGKQREKELYNAVRTLGLDIPQVTILTDFQDNPRLDWNDQLLSDCIYQHILHILAPQSAASSQQGLAAPSSSKEGQSQKKLITIITFDPSGVSGHRNHCSTYRGVKRFLEEQTEGTFYNVRALFLKSMPFWIQTYIPLVYIIELLFSLNRNNTNRTKRHYWLLSSNLHLAWRALACHKSQFVWYRMLSILFSRYTYINVLVEE